MKNKPQKSILILDTPKCCHDCYLAYDCMTCIITGTGFWDNPLIDTDKQILPDCPLTPLPQELPYPQPSRGSSKTMLETADMMFRSGYNECLRQLKGESNENNTKQ